MKFKLDENLPIEATALLRDKGHDVLTVRDEQLTGAVDPAIALVCQQEQRILVTIDLDFADIRHYPPSFYSGIIVLRLARQDRDSVIAIIPRILDLLRKETIPQRLWIMDESRTRIREEP
jgi:predicted nuclease of predicted toxin-antitoxin system